jgi:hypothetical protein
MTLALFFNQPRLRNALNFSGSSPISSSSATSVGTFAKFRSRSHDAVIRVYDEVGNVIEAHEHTGDLLSLQAQAEKRKRREDFHLPALIL